MFQLHKCGPDFVGTRFPTAQTPEAFSEVALSTLLSHFHIMGTDKRKSIGTENSMQSSPIPFFVVAERHENCIVTPFRLNNTAVVCSSIALTCNWSWSRVLMAMNISVMLMLPRPGLFLGRETFTGPCARSVSPKGIICPVVRVGIVVPRCVCYVAGNICYYVTGKLTWPHALSVATWIYPSGCCQVCSCADYVAWKSTQYIFEYATLLPGLFLVPGLFLLPLTRLSTIPSFSDA